MMFEGAGLAEELDPGRPSVSPHSSALSRAKQGIGKAVVDFSTRLSNSTSGSLVQVWMMDVTGNGEMVLSTQGLPFALSGVGDLLALYRCVSCRYRFSTDFLKPNLMGAPGRVYASCEPEMSKNVQSYNKQIYLRVSEAQRCRVHSTLVMPIFATKYSERPMAVIELVQNDKDVAFPKLMLWLESCLEKVHLSTVDVHRVCTGSGLRQWPMEVDKPETYAWSAPSNIEEGQERNDSDGKQTAAAAALNRSQSANSVMKANAGKQYLNWLPPVHDENGEEAESQVGRTGTPSKEPQDPSLMTPAAGAHTLAVPNGGMSHKTAQIPHETVLQVLKSHQQQVEGPNYLLNGAPNEAQLLTLSKLLAASVQSILQGQAAPQQHGGTAGEGGVVQEPGSAIVPGSTQGTNVLAPHGSAAVVEEEDELIDSGGDSEDDGFDEVQLKGEDGRSPSDSSARNKLHAARLAGAGRKLSFEDLQSQFGLGLKEAAGNLGICATTLKRACRRNGITRWPRRQIAKLSRALSQMGYQGIPSHQLMQSAVCGTIKPIAKPGTAKNKNEAVGARLDKAAAALGGRGVGNTDVVGDGNENTTSGSAGTQARHKSPTMSQMGVATGGSPEQAIMEKKLATYKSADAAAAAAYFTVAAQDQQQLMTSAPPLVPLDGRAAVYELRSLSSPAVTPSLPYTGSDTGLHPLSMPSLGVMQQAMQQGVHPSMGHNIQQNVHQNYSMPLPYGQYSLGHVSQPHFQQANFQGYYVGSPEGQQYANSNGSVAAGMAPDPLGGMLPMQSPWYGHHPAATPAEEGKQMTSNAAPADIARAGVGSTSPATSSAASFDGKRVDISHVAQHHQHSQLNHGRMASSIPSLQQDMGVSEFAGGPEGTGGGNAVQPQPQSQPTQPTGTSVEAGKEEPGAARSSIWGADLHGVNNFENLFDFIDDDALAEKLLADDDVAMGEGVEFDPACETHFLS